MSLIVQRTTGVAARPELVPPGQEAILAASQAAGLLVVGLSERWPDEGLGAVRLAVAQGARPPTLIVRSGLRPGGVAPQDGLTRYTWSLAERTLNETGVGSRARQRVERAYQAHVWSACEADPVFADTAARAEKLGVSAELEVAGGRGTDEIVDTIIGIARKTAGNLSGPPCQLAAVGFLGASTASLPMRSPSATLGSVATGSRIGAP